MVKGGMQVSPVVAAVIIVIALAVVGFFVFKATGPKAKVKYGPEQAKEMQKLNSQRPPMPGGPMGGSRSMPPGMGAGEMTRPSPRAGGQ